MAIKYTSKGNNYPTKVKQIWYTPAGSSTPVDIKSLSYIKDGYSYNIWSKAIAIQLKSLNGYIVGGKPQKSSPRGEPSTDSLDLPYDRSSPSMSAGRGEQSGGSGYGYYGDMINIQWSSPGAPTPYIYVPQHDTLTVSLYLNDTFISQKTVATDSANGNMNINLYKETGNVWNNWNDLYDKNWNKIVFKCNYDEYEGNSPVYLEYNNNDHTYPDNPGKCFGSVSLWYYTRNSDGSLTYTNGQTSTILEYISVAGSQPYDVQFHRSQTFDPDNIYNITPVHYIYNEGYKLTEIDDSNPRANSFRAQRIKQFNKDEKWTAFFIPAISGSSTDIQNPGVVPGTIENSSPSSPHSGVAYQNFSRWYLHESGDYNPIILPERETYPTSLPLSSYGYCLCIGQLDITISWIKQSQSVLVKTETIRFKNVELYSHSGGHSYDVHYESKEHISGNTYPWSLSLVTNPSGECLMIRGSNEDGSSSIYPDVDTLFTGASLRASNIYWKNKL